MSNSPEWNSKTFECPHCRVVSHQRWFGQELAAKVANDIIAQYFLNYRVKIQDYQQEAIKEYLSEAQVALKSDLKHYVPTQLSVSVCCSCGEPTVWINREIVYPRIVRLDPPNEDLSEEIQALYVEAMSIILDSPKGAAALLRLCLQKLMIQLGLPGRNLNADIGTLVERGLDGKIQQSLDLLRVVGNNAVHPGQIDFDDKKEVAEKLFSLLNIVASEMISKPNEIERLYDDIMPEGARNGVEKRDGRSGDA